MASSAERVSKHRKALRAQGLKPVQIWVYDTDNPEFRARMERWMAQIQSDPVERDFQAVLEASQDWDGWEADGDSRDDGEAA